MAFRAKTLSISTTPVRVLDASKSIDGLHGSITNGGASVVYIGGDDLTSLNVATNGIPVAPGFGVDDFELVNGEILYAVMDVGSGSIISLASGV